VEVECDVDPASDPLADRRHLRTLAFDGRGRVDPPERAVDPGFHRGEPVVDGPLCIVGQFLGCVPADVLVEPDAVRTAPPRNS